MNILLNLVLLFLYIFISLIIGVPGTSQNIIINKIILFAGILLYQLIIKFTSYNNQQYFKETFTTSLVAILGYSIYIDLLLMNIIPNNLLNNKISNSAIISITIVTVIGIYNIIKILMI